CSWCSLWCAHPQPVVEIGGCARAPIEEWSIDTRVIRDGPALDRGISYLRDLPVTRPQLVDTALEKRHRAAAQPCGILDDQHVFERVLPRLFEYASMQRHTRRRRCLRALAGRDPARAQQQAEPRQLLLHSLRGRAPVDDVDGIEVIEGAG